MAKKAKKIPVKNNAQSIIESLLQKAVSAAPHVGAAISGAAQGIRTHNERSHRAFCIFSAMIPHWTGDHESAATQSFKAADAFIKECEKQAHGNSPPPSIPPMSPQEE